MVGKKILSSFFFRIAIQGLAVLPLIVIGRIAGPSTLGNITLALSFQNIFNSTISSSLGNAHLKLYHENKELGIRTFLNLAFFFRIVIAVIIVAITMGSKLINAPIFSDLQLNLILIFLIQTVIGAGTLTLGFIYTAKLEIAKANKPFLIQASFVAFFQILAVCLGYKEYGIAIFMMTGVLLSMTNVLKQIKSERLGVFDKDLAKKYITLTAGIISGALCHALLLGFDKVALGILSKDAAFLGLYSAGDRVGTLFLALGTSLGGIFLSIFAKNKNNDENRLNIEILSTYEKHLLVLILPAFIGMMVFSGEILTIVFGKRYQSAQLVLVFSLLHAFIKIQNIPLHNIFFTFNKFRYYNFINLIYSLSIVLFPLLFGYFNLFGHLISSVAFGILLTALIERVLLTFFLKKINSNFKFTYHISTLLLVLAYFSIGVMIVTYLDLHFFLKALCFTGIIIGFHFLLLTLKISRKEDFSFLLTFIGRQK